MAKRFRRTLEKAAFCFILVFMLGLLLGQKTVVAKPTIGSMMLATGEQKKAKIYLLPKGAKVTWSIEDSSIAKMEKGESRTLTYYVKLKENATFENKELINEAKAYTRKDKKSTTYLKDEKQSTFNVRIGYDMIPKAIIKQEDGI